jgi:hypothetical protein
MNGNQRITAAVLLLMMLLGGCSESPTGTGGKDTESIPYSEDATLIALYLTDQLTAPDSLYHVVANDLHDIISRYGSEHEKLSGIHFRFPWINDQLIIGFDGETYSRVKDGTYDEWDALNAAYGAHDMKYYYNYVVVSFDSLVHMTHLAGLYRGLAGVSYISRNRWDGSPTNIYPKLVGDDITYLFIDAWGSECITGICDIEYWYFVKEAGGHELFGYWPRYVDPDEPQWWEQASRNMTDWAAL